MKRILFCLIAVVVVFVLSGSVMAGLTNKGPFAYDDGAGHTGSVNLIYDDDFDITWVGDGNFAWTTEYDDDGRMNWNDAKTWAGGLTIGGFADWRLPTALNNVSPFGPDSGYDVTGSEMGHLFYEELGGTARNTISSSTDSDLALFPNLQDSLYWTGTELSGSFAWDFVFSNGIQRAPSKNDGNYGLAVHSGDVAAAVPEPALGLLLGISFVGLVGVGAIRKLKQKAAT